MRRILIAIVATVVLAAPAFAAIDPVDPHTQTFGPYSAASGTVGPLNVYGPNKINVQVCGAAFSGTYTVSQGAKSDKLGVTKSAVTLTTYTGCTEYAWFNPSTYLQVDYTRSAGTVTIYIETFPGGPGGR